MTNINDVNPYLHCRITNEQVNHALRTSKKIDPEKTPMIVTDVPDTFAGCSVPILSVRSLRDMHSWNATTFQTTTPIMAFDSDEIGSAAVQWCKQHSCSFFGYGQFHPVAQYWNINSAVRTSLSTSWTTQKQEGFIKWSVDFHMILQAIEITKHLIGDYIEVGCFRGSSGHATLQHMQHIGLERTCYFLDVFQGFTYKEAKQSIDGFWEHTGHDADEQTIRSRLTAFQSKKLNIHVLKSNIITDDLPTQTIIVANLDVDMYEAVAVGLEKLAPCIVQGGILIVEDPGHTPALIGARLALDEFLESPMAQNFIPVYLETSGQTYLIRK